MQRLLVLASCLATIGAAEAQVSYNTAPPRAGYGGGFIELMMTGREPGGALTAPGPAARAPLPGRAPARPGYGYGPEAGSGARLLYGRPEADPFAEPGQPGYAAPRRLAALPADPLDVGMAPRRGPDPRYARQTVSYDGPDGPGSIVVDTPAKFLYLVQPGGKALRYGIGVGRPGFTWSGVKAISAKREWPSWTPPAEMLRRRPDLPRFMTGGLDNPLGARALYLGSSLYRIHGTNEPDTIGQNVSSGCIRMLNQDVEDLYARVRVGTRVRVI